MRQHQKKNEVSQTVEVLKSKRLRKFQGGKQFPSFPFIPVQIPADFDFEIIFLSYSLL